MYAIYVRSLLWLAMLGYCYASLFLSCKLQFQLIQQRQILKWSFRNFVQEYIIIIDIKLYTKNQCCFYYLQDCLTGIVNHFLGENSCLKDEQWLKEFDDIKPRVFDEMALPSFDGTFLFLARILLDVMHDCLRLYGEEMSSSSLFTIQQVIIYLF